MAAGAGHYSPRDQFLVKQSTPTQNGSRPLCERGSDARAEHRSREGVRRLEPSRWGTARPAELQEAVETRTGIGSESRTSGTPHERPERWRKRHR
ncbi:hypothetical protein NDU88_001399 [Pleurodeles waltl]|uniref:Uncharacterized protein n=1 Tax=Pleurodeles waltl TaxID=8319 RepID=A0AAV7U6X9_PLEWA|nr:hypothetical protein NDU88_001399 [Pleurodeles waltl]